MKKLLILGLSFLALLQTSTLTHAYRDISESSTLRPAIDHFMEKGVLDGRGFFRAEDTMPATWFWEILLQDAGFSPDSARFTTPIPEGVDPDSEEAQYLREAIRRDFINVEDDFDPLKPMRRLEAIRLIVKTKAILPPSRTSDKFRSQVKGVPPTARYLNETEAAFASGILGIGDIQPLRPYDDLKRKDFIQWLYNWEKNGQKKVSSLVKTTTRRTTNRSTTQYPYQKRLQESKGSGVTVGPSTRATSSRGKDLDISVMEKILEQIEEQYRFDDELTPENRKDWINHGIEAMVEQLDDKYSSYIRPDKSEDFLDSLNGQFEGIGAYVEMVDDVFTIRSPIKGSPAEKAGLRPGDSVLQVDGEDISGDTINQTINKVKGPAGTTVTLTIQRNNSTPFDVTVTRGQITIPDVTVENHQGVPVIGIHQFNRDTGTHVEKVLRDEVLPKKPRGIIFDLRNNPGGFLSAAVDVGEIFLGPGKDIFSVDYRDNSLDQKYQTTESGMLDGYQNLVFLQNKGSASASEILNGMVQDYEIGTVIGQTSVGKGTVQSVLNFNNGGTLKMTVAKWLTPNGRWINETGVVPDIEITDPTDEEKLKEVDRQLDRAVQKVLGR